MKVWLMSGGDPVTDIAAFNLRHEFGEAIEVMILDRTTDRHGGSGSPAAKQAFREWALSTAIVEEVDLVIPQKHYAALAPCKDAFEAAGVRLLMPTSGRAVRLLERRDLLGLELEKRGVPFPPFELFASEDELAGALGELQNAGLDRASFQILKADASDETPPIDATVRTLSDRAGDIFDGEDRVLVATLPGPKRVVDVLCRAGRLITGLSHRTDLDGFHFEHSPESLEIAEMATDVIGLNGLCHIVTGEDCDGRQHVLSVAPGSSRGLEAICAAGVNLPAWNVATALDLTPSSQIPGADVLARHLATAAE